MTRRLRPFILITGTLLSLLFVVAFVVSSWWRVSIQSDAMCIIVQDGGVAIQRGVVFPNPVTLERFPGLRHWNRWRINWPWSATAPLYAPFLAVAVPTLLVWRFGPKPVKPGHCRCGYDLHGNESGVCPECGGTI